MNQIVVTSLLGGVLAIDNRSSLRLMISQPLCGGFLTGLILGAPAEGFFAGAIFQMIFLGYVSLRGEHTLDLPLGGVVCAALYILTNRELGGHTAVDGIIFFWSFLLAIVVSGLGNYMYRLWDNLSWNLYGLALRFAKEGRIGLASAIHLSTLIFHFVFGFVVLVVAILGGRAFIVFAATKAPNVSVGSLDMLYILLPFIGVGSLVRLHFISARAFWFGAGFLVSYVFILFRG